MICIKFNLLHRRNASPSVSSKCIEGYVETPWHCYELKNKWKCTEPERKRMSNGLMELHDAELNYIYLCDETDSDDASKNSDEDFLL